ncbi:MAG: class I SAM-dependent methyltransferase [Alphaproteobacteria bacterium]|nr:class I SAM-dependent methyltransferase [Alphaproteobacteria bacterium]
MTEAMIREPSSRLHDTGRFGTVPVVERHCPLCDAEDGAAIDGYGDGIWQLKQCRSCGFVYLDRAPDYAALFSAMAWEKTTTAELERRARLRPISHRVSRLTRARMRLLPRKRIADLVARHARPGNVIDLGCGVGTQLAGLGEGYVPYGVEISSEAAVAADRLFAGRGGRAVNQPALLGLRSFPAGFFSAATLRSYLEHELMPRAVLTELHRTLAPEGVAIVKVPNYGAWNRRLTGPKWCGFRYPDHLNYFTPATLRAMAESCGYRIRFGITDRLPTSDNMYALLLRP